MHLKHTILRFTLLTTCSIVAMGTATSFPARANPENGTVTSGTATIVNSGNRTDIYQSSDRTILDWSRFNLGTGDITAFHQPSSTSVALNRIHDANPSTILGQLTANGTIILINQNGILFGPDSRIDTGSLIATTADIDNNDFMAGQYRFNAPGALNATITNQGTITARDTGLIGLVAPNVENSGVIVAPLGKVQIASAETFSVDLYGDGLMEFAVSDSVMEKSIKHSGHITADGGEIVLTAAQGRGIVNDLVQIDGELRAASVTQHAGKIIIGAPKARVQISGKITTSAADAQSDGGDITIDAASASLGGVMEANGKNGGHISVTTGTLSLAELVEAQGWDGAGGTISYLTSGKSWETSTSITRANGTTDGGKISHIAGNQILSSGTYEANGLDGLGGAIDLTAGSVKLLSTQLTADGGSGGGTIRIGGEKQGGKDLPLDEIPNAQYAILDRGARVSASATRHNGAGGSVILWSDDETLALGTITATPGTDTGAGGFVELSSGGELKYDATVTTGMGSRAGTVLLDPKNITIANTLSLSATAIIMGYGYTGGNNVNVTQASDPENFGSSVSIDGNRIAIGNPLNDGFSDTVLNSGVVYLYAFDDSALNGGRLESIIGNGYTGGKNINLSSLEANDAFGSAVSLDGNNLAIGASGDDGLANSFSNRGAVYLYSFADSAFSSGTLQGTIGRGYTGGKNVDITTLESGDLFGGAVSLDGARIAIGAYNGDGSANATSNSGEAYLLTFTDTAFSGGTLAATIGKSYTGGKNINASALEASDEFAQSLSLSGNTLAIGARSDDGSGNSTSNSGAVYLYTFTDSVFSGGTLQSTMGKGYTGGKNVNLSGLEASDNFGSGVALEGTQLVVGAQNDDGYLNAVGDSGALYAFTFTDTAFSGGNLASTIGINYVGGKNINTSGITSTSDWLGGSVALDNNRVVAGAIGDDGISDTNPSVGAAYTFVFTNSTFTGGILQGTLGSGYSDGANYNLNTLATYSEYGASIALDGLRLAVGNPADDGASGTLDNSGAVYLYTFTDSAFSGASLQAILGYGYTGGKNIDVSTLDISDDYGRSVSLNGNRLAVGAPNDDGAANIASNTGAVYLYSFTDSSFSGGALEATLGRGYTGGKNIDLTTSIGNSDAFGYSVSLDNLNLAASAVSADGAANARTDSGEVWLFNFADTAFTGGTKVGTIGYNFAGVKDLNMALDNSDVFGYSVSLDGTMLAVGAAQDDGFGIGSNNNNWGATYLISFADTLFNTPTLQGIIGKGYIGAKDIDMTSALATTSDIFGNAVSLDGNRLAVGAYARNTGGQSDVGSVFLYSFADSTFGTGVWEGTLGYSGLVGAKDLNGSSFLGGGDYFGRSVSLDGTRLAVGASGDDGFTNAATNTGAAHLFTFTDTAFNGIAKTATFGSDYALGGGKNLSTLTQSIDAFGTSVALDGTMMAIGSLFDDGYNDGYRNSGAVYLFSLANSLTFNSPVLEGIVGKGFTGGKNIDVTNLGLDDQFGSSVSLSDNRLAVGAWGDDGGGVATTDVGAVYLYTFADSLFNTGALQGILGRDYVGGNNLHIAALTAGDNFGSAVSLSGNALAVGAYADDGSANASGNSGGVYLFNFADTAFNGGSLQSIIGRGYTGGKNINVAQTGNSGWNFAQSLSLDNNRLAVGAPLGYSFDLSIIPGIVQLYTFTDSVFSDGTLAATIGKGHTGGNNIDLTSQLDHTDRFGSGVSLEGNRLAVGVYLDDGVTNTNTDAGAAYLFSFATSAFTGGTLEGIAGKGYTGGKNIDITNLGNSDQFGFSTALEGLHLAVGAFGDDGLANVRTNAGAAYILSFANTDFSTGVVDSIIGYNYTGGHNINLAVEASDQFGYGVSLDGNRLAVGAPTDDGNGNLATDSGAVYLFTPNFDDIATASTFASLSGNSLTITIDALKTLLETPQNIILQASNDITLSDDLLVNNASGNGGNLTLQAGRSILLNANITSDNGNVTLYGNENLATGVVNAQRDPGAAVITQAAGKTIDAGTGNVDIRLDNGTGKTNATAGDVTLNNITAGSITVHALPTTSSIILNGTLTASNTGTSVLLNTAKDFTNNTGASAINASAGRFLVYANNYASTNKGSLTGFNRYSCTYSGSCPTVPTTGNGFLFANTPSLTVTIDDASRIYGDTNPTASTYTLSGYNEASDITDDTITGSFTVTSAATSTSNAGTTHALSKNASTLASSIGYGINSSFTAGTLTITKKDITATGATKSRAYGDANGLTLADFTFSGLANSETSSVLDTTAVTAATALSTSNAGTAHNIDLSLLDNNYNLTGYTGGTLTITITITKKDITATIADGSRYYGYSNPVYTFGNVTFSGLANSETGSVIDSLSFNAPTATASSAAGSTHTINMAVSDNNYNLLSYTSGTLTITKAPLVITADDLSRLEFQANPLLTASYNGLRNGDLQNVVSGLTLSTPATFNSIFGLGLS